MEDELARTLSARAQAAAPKTAPPPQSRRPATAPRPRRVAIVGGGWAGLAAAVEAVSLGHAVTLFEMAPAFGGRARRLAASAAALGACRAWGVEAKYGPSEDSFCRIRRPIAVAMGQEAGEKWTAAAKLQPTIPEPDRLLALDNGQHILIGAYRETLRLMALVGVDESTVLRRMPLALLDAEGRGLELPTGPAVPAFVRGVLAARGWSLGERLALLAEASGWLLRGFRCKPATSVAQLTAGLPLAVRQRLIEPLCVAALNTPAEHASAEVFLRVLRDALFAGRGASDLLLPTVDLGALWPDAAVRWLGEHGAVMKTGQRVAALERHGAEWRVEGAAFDAAVLACSAHEAARLAEPHAPLWARTARALRHEPIVTVLLQSHGARLPRPLIALQSDDAAPAQYVFDLGLLRNAEREPGAAGTLAFVVSGAAAWVERGSEATARAVASQAAAQLGRFMPGTPVLLGTYSEKRATFLCTPGLQRPAARVGSAHTLHAAGDYIAGPYPSTLEGAVQSGVAAARAVTAVAK